MNLKNHTNILSRSRNYITKSAYLYVEDGAEHVSHHLGDEADEDAHEEKEAEPVELEKLTGEVVDD